MKYRKSLILALCIFLFAFAAGCDKSPAPPVQADTPPSASQTVPIQTTQSTEQEIIDPTDLEALWQEYIYDSIASVGNTREFHSAAEIDPLYVAEFCWHKYVKEHGKESLELAGKGSTMRLFPLNTVLEYAKRYFDLASLDVSKIDENMYDPKRQAFLFNLGNDEKKPSYDEGNAWGDHLDKVTRNSDGTLTVILVHNSSSDSGLIELIKTLTFKQREDKSLYFESGRWEYINNHLVSLSGDYNRFDKIDGFDGSLDELSMIGEADGSLVLSYTPHEEEKKAALMLIDPVTMTVKKKLEINGNFSAPDVSAAGDNMIVRLKDRFITVGKTLAQSGDTPLPEAIKKKINRDITYNEKGSPDAFFGGYDVSGDGTKYVYTDEVGLKLYNTADNSEKLLSKTVQITGSGVIVNSYHSAPRFVAGGGKVITTMLGYDGAIGYTMYDMGSGTRKAYDIASEASSTGFARYDTGLLEVNVYVRNLDNKTDEYKTVYLDFATGEVQEVPLEDPGDTGDIRMPDYCFVGRNYAAFITYRFDRSNNANSQFCINRLNQQTLQLEPEIITVKAADTHILGVLSDGRIVFWYYLNPSESGICIAD